MRQALRRIGLLVICLTIVQNAPPAAALSIPWQKIPRLTMPRVKPLPPPVPKPRVKALPPSVTKPRVKPLPPPLTKPGVKPSPPPGGSLYQFNPTQPLFPLTPAPNILAPWPEIRSDPFLSPPANWVNPCPCPGPCCPQ